MLSSPDQTQLPRSSECAPTTHPRNEAFPTKLNHAWPKIGEKKKTFQDRSCKFECLEEPDTGEAGPVGKDWDEMVNACPGYENSSKGLFQQESRTKSPGPKAGNSGICVKYPSSKR